MNAGMNLTTGSVVLSGNKVFTVKQSGVVYNLINCMDKTDVVKIPKNKKDLNLSWISTTSKGVHNFRLL